MSTASTNITRDSNAELLRLICMFFIVFHHILVHGAYPELLQGGAAIVTADAKIALILNGLFFPAVNIFILISGYYSIKPTVKKFINLYFFCAFYGLINYFARLITTGQHIGRSIIKETIFPFSHSPYWFIPCYIALFCMAPILNEFIQKSKKKEFSITIILLTFTNVWLGYIGGIEEINMGYCAMQMAYMYIIGGYIKRFVNIQELKKKRWALISIYVLCGALWALSGLIQTRRELFTYNHPFNIMGAIAFFLFAKTFNFYSRTVNWLSASALAVYLIQSAPAASSYICLSSRGMWPVRTCTHLPRRPGKMLRSDISVLLRLWTFSSVQQNRQGRIQNISKIRCKKAFEILFELLVHIPDFRSARSLCFQHSAHYEIWSTRKPHQKAFS